MYRVHLHIACASGAYHLLVNTKSECITRSTAEQLPEKKEGFVSSGVGGVGVAEIRNPMVRNP
ncbi:hypothetical protein AC1031_021069 [Aphanomyces cochlioides]|nr:hypothetical protein AC1031_021069 [Aphanomyces cochlioides]